MFTSKDTRSRAGEYFQVYLALLALTFVAAYLPLGPFNAVAAFGIAAIKAALVGFFHGRAPVRASSRCFRSPVCCGWAFCWPSLLATISRAGGHPAVEGKLRQL